MAESPRAQRPPREHPLADLRVTSVLWLYFTLGYLGLHLPRYLAARLRGAPHPGDALQRVNHRFFQRFFELVQRLAPEIRVEADPGIGAIRSAVVVCNHRSYLDPILLTSLLELQTTIVRGDLLELPIFGRLLRQAGYLAGPTRQNGGTFQREFESRLAEMRAYLARGGNIYIFPEGTRSRDGRLGSLKKGAFALARLCEAPLELLAVEHTERLFWRGDWLFRTGEPLTVRVRHLQTISAEEVAAAGSVRSLTGRVHRVYRRFEAENEAAER